MKYFIQTFGCAANEADSERIASFYQARGYTLADSIEAADDVVINTCMIRQMAEDRVYGLVYKLDQEKKKGRNVKIVVTGCMVGMAMREKTGKMLSLLKKKMPSVDEFLPIEEVGFDHAPVRSDATHALIPITNGCNNFCTFCVVPFTRGREISRPFEEILLECHQVAQQGFTRVTLIGQNVNSYGADLVLGPENVQVMRDVDGKSYFHSHSERNEVESKNPRLPDGQVSRMRGDRKQVARSLDKLGMTRKVTYVKHLGRLRIPTLFPQLLEEICKIEGLTEIDFISSNPWDFSDELIDTIAKNKKISRHIHLPVQAGDNDVLRRMNRWYTREDYLALVKKIKSKIPGSTISTDIIVGFCGETEKQFDNTVVLAKEVGFTKAYIAMYSDRQMTAAHKVYHDDISYEEKKRRWAVLEEMINKANIRAGTYK